MSKEEAEETHRVTAEVFDVVQRLLKQKPDHSPLNNIPSNTPSCSTYAQEPLRYDELNFDTFKHVYRLDHNYQYLYTGDSYSGTWRPPSYQTNASPPNISPVTPEALFSFHPASMPATAWWPHHADGDLQRHDMAFSYYTFPEPEEVSYCDELPESVWSTEDSCQLSSTNALGLVF
jgi:hypothetical protein